MTQIKPRNLRVLLIDDNPVDDLMTRHLDIIRVLDSSQQRGGNTRNALSSWAQHLWLISSGGLPVSDADLILIDCHYDKDSLAPALEQEAIDGEEHEATDELGHERTDDQVADARGLLHGALYIMRIHGHNADHPFGFEIYSQDSPRLKSDPHAQTYTGFLLAMYDALRDDNKKFIRPGNELEYSNVCSKYLNRKSYSLPADAWIPALRRYRNRLKSVIVRNRYQLNANSMQRALDALNTSANLDDLALEWISGVGADGVRIASLFADYLEADKWTDAAREAAIHWLQGVSSLPVVKGSHIDSAVLWTEHQLNHTDNYYATGRIQRARQNRNPVSIPRGKYQCITS